MNGVKTTLGELCESEGKSLLQAVSLTSQARRRVRGPRARPQRHRRPDPAGRPVQHQLQRRRTAQRLVAANAEIAKAQREVRVRQIGVAGAAADAQAKQFQLDQQFGQDSRYVKELAGSYQGTRRARPSSAQGKGMAEHGVGGGIAGLGAQMAVGLGVGNVMAGGIAPPPRAGADVLSRRARRSPAASAARSSRAESSAPSAAAPLVAQKKFCSGCGVELGAGCEVLRRLWHRRRRPRARVPRVG